MNPQYYLVDDNAFVRKEECRFHTADGKPQPELLNRKISNEHEMLLNHSPVVRLADVKREIAVLEAALPEYKIVYDGVSNREYKVAIIALVNTQIKFPKNTIMSNGIKTPAISLDKNQTMLLSFVVSRDGRNLIVILDADLTLNNIYPKFPEYDNKIGDNASNIARLDNSVDNLFTKTNDLTTDLGLLKEVESSNSSSLGIKIDSVNKGLNDKIDNVVGGLREGIKIAQNVANSIKDSVRNLEQRDIEFQTDLNNKVDIAGKIKSELSQRIDGVDSEVFKLSSDLSNVNADLDAKINTVKNDVNNRIEVAKIAYQNLESSIKSTSDELKTAVNIAVTKANQAVEQYKGDKAAFTAEIGKVKDDIIRVADSLKDKVEKAVTAAEKALDQYNRDKLTLESKIENVKSDIDVAIGEKVGKDYVKDETARTLGEAERLVRAMETTLSRNIEAIRVNLVGLIDSLGEIEKADIATVKGLINDVAIDVRAKAEMADVLREINKSAASVIQSAMAEVDVISKKVDMAVAAISGDLSTAVNSLEVKINGKTDESYVNTQITAAKNAVIAQATTAYNTIDNKINTTKKGLEEEINTKATALSNAISTAKSDVLTQVGAAKTDVLGQLSAAKTELNGKITGVEQKLSQAIAQAKSLAAQEIAALKNGFAGDLAALDSKLGFEIATKVDADYVGNEVKATAEALASDIAAVKKTADLAEKANALQGKMITGIAVDLSGGTMAGVTTPGFGVKPRIEKLENALVELNLKDEFLENLWTLTDRETLRTLLVEAREFKNIATSDDGYDLVAYTEYVTAKEKAEFKAIVDLSWETAKKEYLKIPEIKEAITRLETAIETIEDAVKVAPIFDRVDEVEELFSDMYDVLQDVITAESADEVYKNQLWVLFDDKKALEQEKSKLTWLKYPTTLALMSYNDAEKILEDAQKVYDAFEPKYGTKESPAKQPLAKYLSKSASIQETLEEVNAAIPAKIKSAFDDAIAEAQDVIDYEYDDPDEEFEALEKAFEALKDAYEAIVDWMDYYLPGGEEGPATFEVKSMFNAPTAWDHLPVNVDLATNRPTEFFPNGDGVFEVTIDQLDNWYKDGSGTPIPDQNAQDTRAMTWYGEVNKVIGKDFNEVNLKIDGVTSTGKALTVAGEEGGFRAYTDGQKTFFKIPQGFAKKVGDEWEITRSEAVVELIFKKNGKVIDITDGITFPEIVIKD